VTRSSQYPRLLLQLFAIALISGLGSALFLLGLDTVSSWRAEQPWLLLALPVLGVLSVWLYQRFGADAKRGNGLLFDHWHGRLRRIPPALGPLVVLGSWLTHLGGGSAGREGTAVQLGAAVAAQLGRAEQPRAERRLLLSAGIAAGFAGVFGTPWAAAVFSLELMRPRKLPLPQLLAAVLAAWLAHGVVLSTPVQHSAYAVTAPLPSPIGYLWLAVAAACFGLAARFFVFSSHTLQALLLRWLPNPLWRIALVGSVLAALFSLPAFAPFAGLGLEGINEAFRQTAAPFAFLLKSLFTSLTLAAGYKGGEVTPLFFIGAQLGSGLSVWLPLPVSLLAAMGLVGVFAGATQSPLSCWVMGMELFGVEYCLPLAFSVLLAYLVAGSRSIYTNQPRSRWQRWRHYHKLKKPTT
jgi:H+/Cl- antiporter ClcA